jgi:hypothetical protein
MNPRNVETPERMWELFLDYEKQTKSNPRYKTQFVGRDGDMVKEPLERPLTYEGFKNYCYDIVGVVEQYFKNQDNFYDAYIHICMRVRERIRQDQIEGGMVGQYNPSITQRLNGLVEKQETTIKEQPLFPDEV